MKHANLLLTFLIVSLMTACSGSDSGTTTTTTASKEAIVKEITALEDDLYGETEGKTVAFDAEKAKKVITSYNNYVQAFPKDKETPAYLFKAAEAYRSMRDFDNAIKTYQEIYDTYPDYEKTPQCLFLLGFSQENDKNDKVKAKTIYEQFLKKYPTHELADDVKFSLANIDKTPEQIIKEFEAKLGGGSDSTKTAATKEAKEDTTEQAEQTEETKEETKEEAKGE